MLIRACTLNRLNMVTRTVMPHKGQNLTNAALLERESYYFMDV